MRIVIDECVLRSWFAYPQQAGHTVEDWIAVAGGQGSTDDALIAWAQREDTVVLTADNDVGQIVWAQGADRPTVVQLDDPAFRPPE